VVAELVETSRALQAEARVKQRRATLLRQRNQAVRARLLAVRERQNGDAVVALSHPELVGGASLDDELDRPG
jgi:hypothetical protein